MPHSEHDIVEIATAYQALETARSTYILREGHEKDLGKVEVYVHILMDHRSNTDTHRCLRQSGIPFLLRLA